MRVSATHPISACAATAVANAWYASAMAHSFREKVYPLPLPRTFSVQMMFHSHMTILQRGWYVAWVFCALGHTEQYSPCPYCQEISVLLCWTHVPRHTSITIVGETSKRQLLQIVWVYRDRLQVGERVSHRQCNALTPSSATRCAGTARQMPVRLAQLYGCHGK